MNKRVKTFFKTAGYFLSPVLILAAAAPARASSGDFFGLSAIQSLFCGSGPACSQTLPELILALIRLLLFVSGSLAVLFLIIGGFFYITSSGNEERAVRGRKTIVDAIFGLVVIILSYTIVAVLQNTLTNGL